MKRHQIAMSHQYAASNVDNAGRQASATVTTAGASMMFSTLYQQQQHGGMRHPIFTRASDSPHRFDARPAPLISSLQRSHLPGGSAPMHIPHVQPGSFSSRRVSLLRDIGRAGERDRDLPTSGSGMTDLHSAVGMYPGSGSVRHVSNPSQVIPGMPHTFDRPVTLLGNVPHTYQQQFLQDQSPSSHHSHNYQGSRGPVSSSLVEIKKEPGIKQEPGLKPAHNQPSHQSLSGHVPPMSSVQPDVTAQPWAEIEQKSKEDLASALDKVDRELSKVESEINRLQKRKTQLEESAKKPPEPEKEESSPQSAEPKHRDLWQVIYAENRKKAEEARSGLDHICPTYDMPLYNQPSDTKVYQDNLKKNEEMRPKLLKYFQRRRKLENIREKYLSARYDQLMDQWQRKTERVENNAKRKAKDVKTREYFEKLFPEVRKQREQQERVDRVGTRGDTCRSDADFAEIVDGLSEQENQLQHMRQLAVVPPMLLDKEERRVTFINNNGFMSEPFKEFKESQQLDSWADHEKAVFKEKYVQHPKNFNLIASFIEKKSVADCILYYYLTKKTNNYKGLVRKQSMKPRKPKSGRAHAHQYQSSNSSNKESSDKLDKDDVKKEADCEAEEPKIDRPPSPRMTRARKQTMNWTEQEINLVKEGFGKHGRDFSSISRMVANKSEQQVKNFYHNYKKKHGLDQLIAESKKKKTRTRQPPSSAADVTAVLDEDSNSRKSNASPVVETKVKEEKDKSEDNSVLEDKKKTKDRTPSPAVPSSSSSSDPVETLSISTTHIRTRRITAALAAAASQDSHPAEGGAGKRQASDKSSAISGEPAEKKAKKGERKPRSQKISESSKDSVKIEPKEEAASVTKSNSSSKSDSLPPAIGIKKEEETVATETAGENKGGRKKSEDKREKEKENADKEKLTTKPDPSKVSSLPKQPIVEDHDSSATCSADEDAPHDTAVTSVQSSFKLADSPYGFDDDSNDSPTRIRLERARISATSSLSTVVTATVNTQPTLSTGALDLVSKPPTSSSVTTASSVAANDGRPQSLPPGSMVPSVPVSSRPIITSTPMSFAVPGVDISRPSSTPVFGDSAVATSVKLPPTSYPLFHLSSQGQKPTMVMHPKGSVISSTPVIVKSIGDLTYYKAGEKKTFTAATTSVRTSQTVVDLTKDGSASKQSVTSSTSHLNKPAEVSASDMTSTLSRHQYHPSHPIAASLQKDFHPSMIISTPSGITTSLPSGFPRTYSEKDKQAMKDRAAHISEAPIPVSSLRFTSSTSLNLKTPMSLPQQYKTEPTPLSSEQILAAQTTEAKAHSKDDVKPPPLILSGHIPPRSFSPKTNIPRMPGPAPPRMPSVPTSLPIYHKPPPHTDKPLSLTTSVTPASAAVGIRAPSPDKVVPGHVVISGGSITQGKPVFRAQFPELREIAEKEKQKYASPASLTMRGSIVQGIPSTSLVNITNQSVFSESSARRISQQSVESLPGPRPACLPTLPAQAAMFGMRFPTTSTMIPPVKIEKPSDPGPKSSSIEDLRSNVHTSLPHHVPMRLDPQTLGISPNLAYLPGSILPGGLIKGKALEEAGVTSRALSQRSLTPPQSSVPERKVSHIMQHSSMIGAELPTRRGSPAFHHSGEKHSRDDSMRPSSTHRSTPEPWNTHEAHAESIRPSSSHSAHGTSKSRNPLTQDQKLLEDVHSSQAAANVVNQRLFTAAAAAAQMRLPNPYLPFAAPPDQNALTAALIQQYVASAFPGTLLRPSPGPNESLENSRHNVLSQDFATAQRMQQNMSLLAATSSARGSPFSLTPLPAGAVLPGQPMTVTSANPLIPPRHSGSPASMDRFNFIPQHGTSPLSSHLSPRSNTNPSRTPNPQSPSSPHQTMKPHLPSPGLTQFPHDSIAHATADRRKSASPLRVQSSGSRSPSAYSMISQDSSQSSMFSSSSRQSVPGKTPNTLPEPYSTLLAMQGGAARQTGSPHSAYKAPRGKAGQQDFEREEAASQQRAQRERQFTRSPERTAHVFSSEATRSRLIEAQMLHGRASYESAQRQVKQSSSNPTPPTHEARNIPRDSGEKLMQEHIAYSPQTHDKTAKDLKTKGRASMTPSLLIHAIIDQKINQYGDAAIQDKAKQKAPELPPGRLERRPSDPKLNVTGEIDPKIIGIAQKAASGDMVPSLLHEVQRQGSPATTRTKTWTEHSHDIIANMYSRKDLPKHDQTRMTVDNSHKQDEAAQMAHARYAQAPGSFAPAMTASDMHKAQKPSSRSNFIVHPFTVGAQAIASQDGSTVLTSIIRDALIGPTAVSPSSSSNITDLPTRQSRPESNSGQNSPSARATGTPVHPDRGPAAPFRGNQLQPKRSDMPHYGVSPAPVSAASGLQMYSALSFRQGQSSNPNQQAPPPGNVPGRTVPPGSGAPGQRTISNTGTFHPPPPSAPAERTPLPSTQYEPLSDSD